MTQYLLLLKEGYMITKKADAVALLERYKLILAPIIGKPCTLIFDKHKLEGVTVREIAIAKTTGMKNAPDKEQTEDGKNKSPMIFQVTSDQGTLIFTFDHTSVTSLGNGVRFRVASEKPYDVDLRLEG